MLTPAQWQVRRHSVARVLWRIVHAPLRDLHVMAWSVSEGDRIRLQKHSTARALEGICPRPSRCRRLMVTSLLDRVNDSACGSVSSQIEAARHAQLRRRAAALSPSAVAGSDASKAA